MSDRPTFGRTKNVVSGYFRFSILGIVVLLLVLALASQPARAQVLFGSVVGSVTDPTGSVVPGATVKITEVNTNDVRMVLTNEAGGYTVSTVPAGTYQIEITREGFRGFLTSNILVNQNNVVRVDAQLQVGAVSETVQVTAEGAVLQTDRADVHAEVSNRELTSLPQPTRSYGGLLQLVPGITYNSSQLNGGTNNPSKAIVFSFNGTANNAGNVRIEGVSARNPWSTNFTTFVPSIEAIQNVNVATNAQDSEQALAGGASVNVLLKGGTNETHGALFWYLINNATTARNFFAPPGTRVAHQVNNNPGGSLGGRIIRDKLFYFGSYEGDYARQADSGIVSIPSTRHLTGDFGDSPNPIYDPNTGAANGTGRTPFPNNIIPANRIHPVVQKLIPHFPRTNIPGVNNNYYLDRPTVYNLHKIDTKVDYNHDARLRLSGRYGYQPYYNFQAPIYGEVLGGSGSVGQSQSGAGNYLQHGATLAISASATYVASPTFIIDGTWGVTQGHQLLFPNKTDERFGADVLGIPGTNIGPLPWAGGVPNFNLTGYTTMGYSYPALEYKDPIFEYMANVTKIKGTHNIRFGVDIQREHQNHIETSPTAFLFSGAVTTLNGGPAPSPYNVVSNFLLGLPTTMRNYIQAVQPYMTLRTWEYALYVRDQWQVNRKLTLNYGLRWERYPVPTQQNRGISLYDFPTNTIAICGVGGNPIDCGIQVSNKLFAPNIGIAWRALEKFVVRLGYSLNPITDNMARSAFKSYPDNIAAELNAPNPFAPAGDLTTGVPVIPEPTLVNGRTLVPPRTGNVSGMNNRVFVRGYYQSYNFTLQREFLWGLVGQAGYVATRGVKLNSNLNVNYGQIGGGPASQPLFPYGITSNVNINQPAGASSYHSLQATLRKRFASGFTMATAYTFSKYMTQGTQIRIPGYEHLNRSLNGSDRPHTWNISGTYELPFGRGKPFLQQGVLGAIAGGWTINGFFSHISGTPFSITGNAASCNCPGNTQRPDVVKDGIAKVGTGVGGQPYFDPLAFAQVTTPRFGTAGFNLLRGPGNTNVDLGLFRDVPLTERTTIQVRAEALNVSNTPHFANPGSNLSNLSRNADGSIRSLGGFSQITSTLAQGRLIDSRYFRFGLRLMF
jgi:hypothetical protein